MAHCALGCSSFLCVHSLGHSHLSLGACAAHPSHGDSLCAASGTWRNTASQTRWVPLSEISPALPRAVISSEDQRFMQHNGFDAQAIGYAVRQRLNGGKSGGGSTISQQTAKNVFLWPTSSWVRKGFEVYFTVLIELLWSKERIMEVYLNSIEMGDGIYGAEAVAQENFHCSASELSRKNCAMIAASLPAPLRFNSAEPTPYMRSRQRWILHQMKHIKPWKKVED